MTIRFGVLGPGHIARKFVGDLVHSARCTAVAVGSRSAERARAFAAELGVARAHGSYEALVSDPEVDVVYVATPHPFHVEHGLLALRAGKGVLCEKPVALDRGGVEALVAEAAARGLFFMEAMWTRFIPACARVKELVDAGEIGEPRWFQADFGFTAPPDPGGRHLAPELGGGALLDIGIYPVSMARWLLGPVEDVTALATPAATGVDGAVTIALRHRSGALSALSCSFLTGTPTEAVVSGTGGWLRLPAPFHHARSYTLRHWEHDHRVELDYPGSGYQFEADEVAACLTAGRTQSDRMRPAESAEIVGILDAIREQVGL